MWSVGLVSLLAIFSSLYRIPTERLDLRLLILAVMTLFVASRITIKLPKFDSHISVSDTFIFLTMLLYGGEVAVLLAAIESTYTSSRICKKRITIFFNVGVMSLSTWCTYYAATLFTGNPTDIVTGDVTARSLATVCVMGLVQYLVNSVCISVYGACRTDQPLWRTWRTQYLWSSVTFFVGATAAVLIAKIITAVGLFGVLVTTPIIFILYITYQTYLKNVEAASASAEQAKRHVEELSQYIEEQERIREQFAQVEKLSALGELASGVAHDFNNTLAGILGRAELMMRKTPDADMKRGLGIIIKSAQDGAKTVKRIQDFARQRRDLELEIVPVSELLNDISEITRPRWKTGAEAKSIHIELEVVCADPHLAVLGDPSELRDVLVNMVFNAVDAMPEGGRLGLGTRQNGESVEITISDSGLGMTPEVRSRIFDPFYTTKGQAGMGLGLAVSYGIIRRHSGNIEVESEIGKGTTMCISLPLAKIEAGSIAPKAPAPELIETVTTAAQGGNVRSGLALVKDTNLLQILVVDDEEKVRVLLSEMLEDEGYTVTTASSGAEALETLSVRSFDLVFTDVGMPGMSGWEMVRTLRERGSEVPVAVVTGWGETVSSNDRKEADVQWVLAKPFSFSDIIEIAEQVAGKGAEALAVA